jgi:hypothetical protein
MRPTARNLTVEIGQSKSCTEQATHFQMCRPIKCSTLVPMPSTNSLSSLSNARIHSFGHWRFDSAPTSAKPRRGTSAPSLDRKLPASVVARRPSPITQRAYAARQ